MNFFPGMLSISKTCYAMAIISQRLSSLLSPPQAISIPGCAPQLFLLSHFGVSNCFLLTEMGYDCYVAICYPPWYSLIMGTKVCLQLASGPYSFGLSVAIVQVSSVFSLPFCDASVISHFFCDSRPLMKLTCADTTFKENPCLRSWPVSNNETRIVQRGVTCREQVG
ncbi:Olfactory receptor 10J4 [Fukomys damarensis]|uniref:Olfactory receptor 10J4 n=1 Tax=Fukomys damarensis TaxID=885580 RepID=A0A091CTY4_FUKDA|nr:Olfactory receptor 10J4 [Fukomys damarensis]